MQIKESWRHLMFDLHCLSKRTAKKQFKHLIRSSFGGLCAYCRCQRATTVDHIIPKCNGGTSFKNNLLACCVSCNRSKGSENWLEWYSRQEFYNKVAKEVIQEWIDNREYRNDYSEWSDNRAKICITTSKIRSVEDEPTCSGEDSATIVEIQDGAEEWSSECAYG